MRINRIKLRNYRKFRHADIEFGNGIISINGLNGSGKSSLVEAIAWALYGNDRRIVRDEKEYVKFSGSSPSDSCSVEIEFEIEGDNYHLTREMRGKTGKVVAEIKQNGIPQASTDRGVKEFIEKRLGLDAEGFLISVFARQKELNALSNLTKEQRKKKIENMLGLDIIEDARKMINTEKNQMRREVEGMRRSLYDEEGRPVSENKKRELEKKMEEIKRSKEELEKKSREMEKIEGDLIKAEKNLDELREREKKYQRMLEKKGVLKKE